MSATAPQETAADDKPSTSEEQLKLPGAEELFAAVGLNDLPHGAAELTKKELAFALAYVRTGNAAKAAQEAGYSDPGSNAAKLLKRTDILRFLTPALKAAGNNAEAQVVRVAQRSRTLHDELMELREKGELRDMKRERQLIRLVNQTDALLGGLLGKLSALHVTADINHTVNGKRDAVVVPAAALPALAQMRRDVVLAAQARTGGAN